jgi:protein-disulfide isomerase-like protein with CxxC motif
MSKSYARNIQRLRANQSQISAQEQGITTETARTRGEYEIAHARNIATKLTPFSKALQDWKDKDIEKKIEEGKAALDKAEADKAKLLTDTQRRILEIEENQRKAKEGGELELDIQTSKAQEVELQNLKNKLLDEHGTDGYPDADRLAQLSPWQQVGWVQQDIKNKKNAFGDMLAHSMQNGEENLILGKIQFNAKEISGNKLAFQMKQHAVHYYADKIYRNLGLDKYSQAMLDRSKIAEHIRTAKEAQIAKHRKEYNIESSMNTQKKATLNWNEGPKTGKDAELFILTWGGTVDTKNNRYGHVGGLNQLFKMWTEEGVRNGGDNSQLQVYHDMPLPESLRLRVGAKPGATFGSHWPKRFEKAEQGIIDGNTAVVENRLKNQQTDKKNLEVQFNEAKMAAYKEGRSLSQREVNQWIDQFQAIGETPPDYIKNYVTSSERQADKDEDKIQNHIDLNGYITNAELDHFHPLAAGKFREKADKWEKAKLVDSGAQQVIKGALDDTFAHMGVKDREKSMAYQIAKKNAEEDFHKQYSEYVGMGLPEKVAVHLALHGVTGIGEIPGEVKTYIQGRQGVAEEILKNGENSKYTKAGLHIENTVGGDFKRMAHAITVKKNMRAANQKGVLLRQTKILGGDYGQQQLDAIKANIKQYGFYRGIAMSEEHTQFYKAIMAGRNLNEGGWWGLLHDQLILDDPSGGGLERNEVANSILPLLTRKVPTPDGEEEDLQDEDGVTEVSSRGINAANNGAPLLAYNYITDAENYYNNKSNGSIFDQPDQIPAHLGGTA